MNERLSADDPNGFAILSARLAEAANDWGVSDRTLSLHRFLMVTCAMVTAIVLGICSVAALDMQVGQVTFASGGWLSLAMTLIVLYASFSYFTHYWQEKSLSSFRKSRILPEARFPELMESARSHHLKIARGDLSFDEVMHEAEIGDAKNAAIKAVASHLKTSRLFHFVNYGLLPVAMVAIALIALVTQGAWQFSALPPQCVST